jgi:arylsulfatase A-like enzyme
MLAAEWGFARGFEIYDEEKNTDHGRLLSGYVRQTFDRGLAWLDANRDSTFFLFLHTYQVHNPYDPPEKYGRPFRDPDRTDQPGIDIDGYDGEIRYTDAELRRLVDALTRRGILDDTVLVVTSDHGEEFNEHGGRFHSSQVYEEILHVPLLVRAPGLLPEGARRAGPVLLLDLPRTLLDLLGVPVHTVFDGISVREHLAEAAPLPTRRFTAVANGELRFTYAGLDPSWLPPTYAAVQFPWKLIRKNTRDGPAYELYDVVADPGETRNRYDEVTDVAAALRAMLQRHDGECRSRQAKLLREWGRPVGNATAVGDDAERLQKLKALGYLE